MLMNDLDAIESDKEGEDILTSIQKPGNFFKQHLNSNAALFENFPLSTVKSEGIKTKTLEKSPHRIISDLEDNEVEVSGGSSEENQNEKELEEIKENIYKIRKLTKNTPATFAAASGAKTSFHHRARSKYINDYMR